MSGLFESRITHIYLVYGLGFYTLGLAVALEVGRITDRRFARALRYLSLFGLVHGTHEWVEMFGLIGLDAYGFVPPPWWGFGRLILLSFSFAALVGFGVNMLYTPPTRPSAGLWGTLGMVTLFAAGAIALGVNLQGDDWLRAADAWTRYSLGVPGALLASAALVTQWRSLRRAGLAGFGNAFLWAAIVFALYGVVGQTIVPRSELFPSTIINADRFQEWSGFPIQILRSVFSALMALFMIRGLRAFEVDRQRRLAAAERQAREAIARRDALRGELFRRTVAAQEEERARLARELHDDTLQVLTGLSTGLAGTEQLMVSSPAQAREQLARLTSMSSHAIDELRRLIVNLRPSVLDDMGLIPAIRWYSETMADRMETTVEVTAGGMDRRLPGPVETILFRIAQEGLHNIANHARAKRAAVRMQCDERTCHLEIEDDGVGFDAFAALQATPALPGWGLVGIQERVALAGGQFRIESASETGTTLHVTIPASLSQDPPDEEVVI
jgi:signal transduction histidine kinase